MRRIRSSVSVLGALLGLAAGAPPQATEKPVDPGLVERVTTRLLQLNLLAVDSAGRAVTDLRPDEVELTVNGNPQRVAFLQAYYPTEEVAAAPSPDTTEDEDAPVPEAARERGSGRWIVLLFDNLASSQRTRLESIRAAREFAETRIGPNDRVAIAVFDGGLRFLQSFTTDLDSIGKAIDGLSEHAEHASEAPDRRIDTLVSELENCGSRAEMVPGGAPITGATSQTTGAAADFVENCALVAVRNYEAERSRELDALTGSLRWLLYATASIPDLKAILFFSEGVSRDPARDAIDVAQAVLGSGYARLAQSRSRAEVEDRFDEIAEAAAAAKASIFTINPGGASKLTATSAARSAPVGGTVNVLQIDPYRSAEKNAQEALYELSWRTGGTSSQGADIAAELARIDDLSAGLYTVGYYPSPPEDPDSRKKVKIRILRKGVKAEFQRDVPASPDRAPLGGELTVEPGSCDEGGKRAVTVRLRIDRSSLSFEKMRGNVSANFSMLVRFSSPGAVRPTYQDFRTMNVTNTKAEHDSGAAPDPVVEQRFVLPCAPLSLSITATDAGSGSKREFTADIGS